MRRAIGSALIFLSAIAPALAQGPMSPVSLSNKTVEAPEPPAPPPPPQASVALPPAAPTQTAIIEQSATVTSPNLASAAKPATPVKTAPVKKHFARKAAPKDEVTVDATEVADSTGADPAIKRADKRPAIDPDHMASMLNQMQLDGGYGATTTVTITRISPSAGE